MKSDVQILLYLLFSYYEFRITSKVKIGNANKFLLAFISNSKEDMVAFFYLFNLFESSLIILFSCYGLEHNIGVRIAMANIMINPEFMQILVIPNDFSDRII